MVDLKRHLSAHILLAAGILVSNCADLFMVFLDTFLYGCVGPQHEVGAQLYSGGLRCIGLSW